MAEIGIVSLVQEIQRQFRRKRLSHWGTEQCFQLTPVPTFLLNQETSREVAPTDRNPSQSWHIFTNFLNEGYSIQKFSIWFCWIAKSSKNGFGFGNPSQPKRVFYSNLELLDIWTTRECLVENIPLPIYESSLGRDSLREYQQN